MSKTELTLMQMNDSHAYFELHPELFWQGDHAIYRPAGGYARIATLLKQVRRETAGAMLAFDGGDTIHGTYAAVQTQGQALVPVLNALRFDGMTAHWEYAYGPQRFQDVVDQLDYPMLANNIYDEKTDQRVYEPYKIFERGGLRIGVIGIAATIVDKVMPASFSKGLYFTLGNQELPGLIAQLRQQEKVDLIVVVSHLGFAQEMKLAQEVPGIDVVLSSHTHNRLYRPAKVDNTILIQSGCHGSFLGRLDLEIEHGRIVDMAHRLITVKEEIVPDADVQAMIDETMAPYRQELGQVVGHTATALNRNRVLEATMDNLLLQSIQELTGAQLAFSNGWRYGAPVLPGPVTMNDLWNIIPVDPPVSTCTLRGQELWEMLEDNLERTFARDPYEQMGGYVKRCLGLNLYFKVENPYGQRIEELFVQDKPVERERDYEVAFVTEQGVPTKYGSQRQQSEVHAIEALTRYLGKHDPAQAELRDSVVAV